MAENVNSLALNRLDSLLNIAVSKPYVQAIGQFLYAPYKFGGRPNFGGFRWHEFYPAYPLLRLLNRAGIVKLRFGRDETCM